MRPVILGGRSTLSSDYLTYLNFIGLCSFFGVQFPQAVGLAEGGICPIGFHNRRFTPPRASASLFQPTFDTSEDGCHRVERPHQSLAAVSCSPAWFDNGS